MIMEAMKMEVSLIVFHGYFLSKKKRKFILLTNV